MYIITDKISQKQTQNYEKRERREMGKWWRNHQQTKLDDVLKRGVDTSYLHHQRNV